MLLRRVVLVGVLVLSGCGVVQQEASAGEKCEQGVENGRDPELLAEEMERMGIDGVDPQELIDRTSDSETKGMDWVGCMIDEGWLCGTEARWREQMQNLDDPSAPFYVPGSCSDGDDRADNPYR